MLRPLIKGKDIKLLEKAAKETENIDLKKAIENKLRQIKSNKPIQK